MNLDHEKSQTLVLIHYWERLRQEYLTNLCKVHRFKSPNQNYPRINPRVIKQQYISVKNKTQNTNK